MPWCENDSCKKTELKKDEVVFDEKNKQVLCIPCGQMAALSDPTLMGQVADKTYAGVHYTTDQGFKAELVHRGARLEIRASNEQISEMLNGLGMGQGQVE